jgi:hypothetical protein
LACSHAEKEKNFSLACQPIARITWKPVTTCIPKSLPIHRFRTFLPDTSLYVANNLRGSSQGIHALCLFGPRFA